MKEEGFLEYVNQLLMTGEVAGLFPRDELDAILNDLRPAFKRECPGAPPAAQRKGRNSTRLLTFLLDDILILSSIHAHASPLLNNTQLLIGVPDTGEAVYAFFLGRVRDRLHVVLCFSPVGARFSRRAQQFPGLINGCTIDWFLAWPEEALTAVSSKAIDKFPMACPAPVRAASLPCACAHALLNARLKSHVREHPISLPEPRIMHCGLTGLRAQNRR